MEENIYNFDEFTDYKGKFAPRISIGQNGGFGFSSGFMNKYSLSDYHFLKIFFDKEHSAIGFKFFKTSEPATAKLRNLGAGGYFKSSSFWGKYNFDYTNYIGRYTPKEINNNGEKMYVIDLKEVAK